MQTIAALDISDRERWFYTRDGQPRGYIEAQSLTELWFHTGTACNLSCPFCLEGSKPGDNRLQLMTLTDAQPFIDEAMQLGVERFSFTGGEPFVARDMHRILAYAARHRRPPPGGVAASRHRARQPGAVQEHPYQPPHAGTQ